MEEKITCYECGCIIEDGEQIAIAGGEYICEDCYNDTYYTCEICGTVEHCDNTHYIDDTTVCDDCFDRLYEACANCGDHHHVDDMHSTRDGYVCGYCLDNNYVECCECGELLHIDNSYYNDHTGDYYCEDCYDSNENINDYYYKPCPIFYGDNSNLYMGVELEIDGAGENSNNAGKLLGIDGNDRIYCKHDGSLDNGFEIVSHPCTLNYHRYSMEWENICKKAVSMGYTSHDAKTCGLHIHISKKALGDNFTEQDENIAKILYFIEKYFDKFLILSRRTQEQLDRWASRYGIEQGEKPLNILDKAKNNCNRYRAVNLQNSHTVEFRFFRGTLNYNTFIATLELVQHLCDMCLELSENDIQDISWREFCTSIKNADTNYSELIQYMTDRKIMEV